MTVFKGYLKLIRQSRGMILVYLAIFFACTIVFQISAQKSDSEYQVQSLNIVWIDENGGTLAGGLKAYLGQQHKLADGENEKSVLQEKLFYGDVDYVVWIPEDFYEACVKNGEKLRVTKRPGSYSGIYVDQMMNSYLNHARIYAAAGFSEEETVKALANNQSAQVVVAESGAETESYTFYFRFMPYLFLALFGFVLGNILASTFRKKECRRRMYASPVSPRRQSLEGLICMGVFGAGLWGLMILAGMVVYGKKLIFSGMLPYYLLNSAVLALVALALAYLVGMLAPGRDALTGIVNVLSLGMCFLGGTFVPLEVMNRQVKAVAQFLPVYWYEMANDILGEFTVLTDEARLRVLEAVGIQAVFALTFLCLTLAAAKSRGQES